MSKNKDIINENSQKNMIETDLKKRYEDFLKQIGVKGSPENASIFAENLLERSKNYKGYTIRQIIILLEKKLPYMF